MVIHGVRVLMLSVKGTHQFIMFILGVMIIIAGVYFLAPQQKVPLGSDSTLPAGSEYQDLEDIKSQPKTIKALRWERFSLVSSMSCLAY